MGKPVLSSKERTLLHLHRMKVSTERRVFPFEICQEGIARATGLLKTHVPRTVKGLEEEGFVESKKGYVKEKERKLKVYFITLKGEEFVSTIEARLFKMDVGITTETGLKISKLEDILKEESRYGIDILDLLDSIDDEGNVSLSNLRFAKGNMSKDKFNVPEYGEFIDRTAEMNALRSWYEDESPLMLVTGQKGMGKTVLAAHFCQHDVDDKSVLWFDIPRDRQAESLLKTASHFFEKMGLTGGILSCKDFVEILICAPVILVVDGYYEVEEEMVDLMIDIVRNLKMGVRGKILVTSPTGTPSYSRFFTLSELESGKVRQMVLKGVDDEGARHILGTNTSSENLRKIYLLTKHNPSWLVMIKNEDENGLLEKTRLTKEEIRLLFFWKR